jgi:thermostable 8-oxoguanine DNA glycosylase
MDETETLTSMTTEVAVGIPRPSNLLKDFSPEEYSDFLLHAENQLLKNWIANLCCLDHAIVEAQIEIKLLRALGELKKEDIEELLEIASVRFKEVISKRSALFSEDN